MAGIIADVMGVKGPPADSPRRIMNPSLSLSEPVVQVRTTWSPSIRPERFTPETIVGVEDEDDDDSATMKGEKLAVLPQIMLAAVSRLVVMSFQLPSQWKIFRFRSVANCVSS